MRRLLFISWCCDDDDGGNGGNGGNGDNDGDDGMCFLLYI